MTGLVIVPSRGRPGNVRSLLQAFKETGANDVFLEISVNVDDPRLEEYTAIKEAVAYPPARMGPTLNLALQSALAGWWPSGPSWIGFMGDDHRPRTPGWRERVEQTLAAYPGVCYGNDLLQGARLATSVFVSTPVLERLGYMVPPNMWHLYLDDFWMELGRATHLTYMADVVIEHVHPFAGKAEMDEGYVFNNSHETEQHDKAEYERFMREDWPTEKLKLCGL